MIRAWDWEKAEPRGVLLGLRDDLGLTISPLGHYQGCNARHLRYVVETDDGAVQTLTAEQFKKTHGWVNENDKAALIP